MNVGDAHRHLRSSETLQTAATRFLGPDPPNKTAYRVQTPRSASRRKQNSSEWAHELRRLPSVIQDDPTGINSLALEAVGPAGWNGVAQAVLTGCGFYSCIDVWMNTEMILRMGWKGWKGWTNVFVSTH